MSKKTLLIFIITVVVLISGYAIFNRSEEVVAPATEIESKTNTTEPAINKVVTEGEPVTPAEIEKDPVKENTDIPIKLIDNKVPFTPQAPNGGWEDQRQQDGCEEASALMAMRWVQGKSLSRSEALSEILAISDFEQATYGEYRDVSVYDVRDWIFKDYFKYDKVSVKENVTIADIAAEIGKGNLVIAPMNGQLLGNPYFTAPGPERHMLLIRGYDPKKKQFITNEPGTKHGEAYRYNEETLFNAIMSYDTGYHIPVNGMPKHVVIVSK